MSHRCRRLPVALQLSAFVDLGCGTAELTRRVHVEGVSVEVRVTGQVKPLQRALVEQYFELVMAARKDDADSPE
jgi:hypothetical protein